jgi:D-amino peptidase
MRVHIISDMEGVSGIVKWEQTTGGDPMYEEGRRLYTEEINAAIRGARAGGATEIVVMDCHGAGKGWSFNSLIPDQLDDGCEFVVQQQWTEYTDFLETGCDAALFVGMHAMAGTPDGVLNHTVSGQQWQNLWFNGTLVGETGINAALCGQWDCPVLLVTGDRAVCREGKDLLGDGLTTVEVKEGLGQFSARQLPARRARQLIEEGAKRALQNLGAVQPYDPGRPAEIKVEFKVTDAAREYGRKHGVEQLDARTIVSRGDDWWSAWQQFFFGR